jgi:hypothetical protein
MGDVGDVAIGLESSDAVSSWVDERSDAVWIELGFTKMFIEGIDGAFRIIMGTPCLEVDSAGEYTVELCPSALKSSSVSTNGSAGVLE